MTNKVNINISAAQKRSLVEEITEGMFVCLCLPTLLGFSHLVLAPDQSLQLQREQARGEAVFPSYTLRIEVAALKCNLPKFCRERYSIGKERWSLFLLFIWLLCIIWVNS